MAVSGRGGLRSAASFVGTVLVAVVIAFLLRTFVVGVYQVPSGSMLDTIQIGDLLIGEKVTLRFDGPHQGDVVTFDSPRESGVTLIKRVVATAGQQVDLVDGTLYVDGVAEDAAYTEGKPTYSLSDMAGSAGISYPYVVPEGCIFVMGDNRTNSADSRFFGPVSVSAVTSRALFIYWPLSDARTL